MSESGGRRTATGPGAFATYLGAVAALLAVAGLVRALPHQLLAGSVVPPGVALATEVAPALPRIAPTAGTRCTPCTSWA
jgi:hypothetical protein